MSDGFPVFLCHPHFPGAVLLGTATSSSSAVSAVQVFSVLTMIEGFSLAHDLTLNIPEDIGCFERCLIPSDKTVESCPEYELPEYNIEPVLNKQNGDKGEQ